MQIATHRKSRSTDGVDIWATTRWGVRGLLSGLCTLRESMLGVREVEEALLAMVRLEAADASEVVELLLRPEVYPTLGL